MSRIYLLKRRRAAKVWALGNAQQIAINETFGSDAGDDTFPWANATPINLDKFGNLFTVILRYNANNKRPCFLWRNVGSGVWTDNPIVSLNDGQVGELGLDQAQLAYDRTHDIIHALWVGTSNATGILYRRYVILRDGSNNIVGIDWDYTDGTNTTTKLNTRTNLQLDFNGLSYVTMQISLLTDAAYGTYGALLAVWNGVGSSGTELRAAMCVFGATAQQGKTAANWTNLGLTTTNNAFGCTINVAYNAIVSRGTSSFAILPVIARKQSGTHANDIYLGYCDQPGAAEWRYTRLIWASATNNWTTQTAPVTLSLLVRAGTDTGYTLKQQLMSAWAEDTANDRMYIGFASWKSNVAGDTWSFVKVDSADAITLVDVHSASGAHVYAPTGSVAFDNAKGLLVVAYDRGSDAFGIVQLYKDTATQGSAIVATTTNVDVPTLTLGATMAAGEWTGKVPLIFRDIVNTPTPPYHAWWVTLDWQ